MKIVREKLKFNFLMFSNDVNFNNDDEMFWYAVKNCSPDFNS